MWGTLVVNGQGGIGEGEHLGSASKFGDAICVRERPSASAAQGPELSVRRSTPQTGGNLRGGSGPVARDWKVCQEKNKTRLRPVGCTVTDIHGCREERSGDSSRAKMPAEEKEALPYYSRNGGTAVCIASTPNGRSARREC